MPKKKTKGYSPEVRQEAIRLFEQNHTLAQVAEQLGCSTECARQWRKKYLESKPDVPTENTPSPVAVPTKKLPKEDAVPSSKKNSPDFDAFIRGYWQEGTRAVDVLLLPPEIGLKVVNYVNEALKYAYERLR